MRIVQDPISFEASRLECILRLEKSFEQLSVRIVRLAKYLDAHLDTEGGIDNAIHKASQMIECTHDHKTRLWHELRGLLVLRYKMEKTNTEELGITVIQTVIAEVEQHLAASGYAEKIDGLNLSEVLWQTAAGDR